MAEADDFEEAIDNELKCPLCLSRFRTPKDLDCPHVYCKECLENLHRSSGSGQTIDCPECRHITVIHKGIDGLKTNLRLRNMVEAAERKDELQKKGTLTRPKVPDCGEHEGEKLHLYCETDDYLVCHVCAVADHPYPEHKCRNVKEVVEEQKDTDAGGLCKASQKLDELAQESKEISEVEKTLTEFMAAEEADILRCVRNIQKAVQQRGAAMINTMRQMHEEHINDLQEVRAEVDDMSDRLQTVCEAIRENLNNATDYEYVAQHQTLHSNLMMLIKQKITASVDKKFPRIKFVPNKGADSMVKLGYLQTSKVKDVSAELCGQLTFACSNSSKAEKIEDIAALSDGSLALVFKSRVGVYRTEGKYENVADEEYKLQLSIEPPFGYKDKPCWVSTSSSETSLKGTWLPHGVAEADKKYVIIDRTPYVKIFSISGKFQSMFSTMTPSVSKLYRQMSGEYSEVTSSDQQTLDVNYTCIAQDVDNKTLFLGDYARKVITTHDSSGKCLNTFRLQDAPYKINIFGQRIAVTTIADKIDLLDKITGEKVLSVDVALATGACVDIKSGCMFVTTTDADSYEYENGTLEAYCSMTGKHIRCLVPMLYEPCGAMTLTSDERLAVVDKEGVNFYLITYTYE